MCTYKVIHRLTWRFHIYIQELQPWPCCRFQKRNAKLRTCQFHRPPLYLLLKALTNSPIRPLKSRVGRLTITTFNNRVLFAVLRLQRRQPIVWLNWIGDRSELFFLEPDDPLHSRNNFLSFFTAVNNIMVEERNSSSFRTFSQDTGINFIQTSSTYHQLPDLQPTSLQASTNSDKNDRLNLTGESSLANLTLLKDTMVNSTANNDDDDREIVTQLTEESKSKNLTEMKTADYSLYTSDSYNFNYNICGSSESLLIF